MNFDNDIFVSYAHIDDQPLVEGQKGWISSFHRALEVRLSQLMGREPRIWRDPQLQGNDIYADRLVQCLPGVGVLCSIVSPRYVRSDWCVRELREFVKATDTTGGIRQGDKARVFKIVKTPVPLDQQPDDFQELLGYDFYVVDPETGRARELSQTGDAESQRLYWMKLDDLAHDIAESLEMLEPSTAAGADTPSVANPTTVYLAETSFDLREERDVIKRELLGHGHVVLPDRPLPLVGSECEDAIREQIARCSLSIHLIGKNYGLIPEGVSDSIVVMQNEVAIERGAGAGFSRLIWLPPDLTSEEEKQVHFIERLQTDVRIQEGADLLQTSLEDFKSVALDRARPEEKKEAAPDVTSNADEGGDALVRVYVIYDQRDGDGPAGVEDYLFKKGFEVIVPVFDGDEAQVRHDHEENLSMCDGVLLYYGAANELWLRRKLREIQKSAAFGRQAPIGVKAILVAPPDTGPKNRLRTREALVINQKEAFDPSSLEPFVNQLRIA